MAEQTITLNIPEHIHEHPRHLTETIHQPLEMRHSTRSTLSDTEYKVGVPRAIYHNTNK